MITKEHLLAIASEHGLLATTVNKDYALGWLLVGIGQHPLLSNWVFKGGTCLKKAYFDTYRFSEDLDFTIPKSEPYAAEIILKAVKEAAANTYELSGVEFLQNEIQVTSSVNKRDKQTFVVKLPFQGPLRQQNKAIQRITFDITQDEILVDTPELRTIFHGYSDAPTPPGRVRCYSVNEIIAEKSRALYERQGRSRDVYDVVNISRNFRDEIDADLAKGILKEKFKFKDLPDPNVDLIFSRIDQELLKQSWDHQLKHQVPILPPVESFIADLGDALRWWIDGISAPQIPLVAAHHNGETTVPRERFSAPYLIQRGPLSDSSSWLNQIRFAARNQVCVSITYKGIKRLAEPYSLRVSGSGNLFVYIFELKRGEAPGGGIKTLSIANIQNIEVTAIAFKPRYKIEL